jgi:hypothetical protein
MTKDILVPILLVTSAILIFFVLRSVSSVVREGG